MDAAAARHLSGAERDQPAAARRRASALAAALAMHPDGRRGRRCCFRSIIVLALLFGVLLIIPIGGADMPTVIAILNSYAGLSAVAMGFVLDNKLLITAGALDGSSGLILSIIMCKAMNRSFTNVLFGAFGQVQQADGRRRAEGVQVGDAPKARRRSSSRRASSSSSPATAWRSRRRSTRCASCTIS